MREREREREREPRARNGNVGRNGAEERKKERWKESNQEMMAHPSS